MVASVRPGSAALPTDASWPRVNAILIEQRRRLGRYRRCPVRSTASICRRANRASVLDPTLDLAGVVRIAEVTSNDQFVLKLVGSGNEVIQVHVAMLVNFLFAMPVPQMSSR